MIRDELLLTREHMLAFIEMKLALRKLDRKTRSKSALKGWDTRREART